MNGSLDFSNIDFEVLVINGYGSKDPNTKMKVTERKIRIPISSADRKGELIKGLQEEFRDGRRL